MSLNYAEIVKPLGYTTDQAGLAMGNAMLFEKMVVAGWIKPIIDRNRCRLYEVEHVARCWHLVKMGYYPAEKEPPKTLLPT